MKRLSIIFVFVAVLYVTSFSQNTFEHRFINDLNQLPFGCITDSNENVIIAIDNIKDETRHFPEFIKISTTGEVVKRKTLEDGGSRRIRNLTKYSDSVFFAIGGKIINGKDHFWIAKFDYDLNLLEEKDYEMGDYNICQAHTVIKQNGNILCGGNVIASNEQKYCLFLAEFSKDFSMKYLETNYQNSGGFGTDLKYDSKTDSYIFFTYSAFDIQSTGQMVFINEVNGIDSIIKIPAYVGYQITTKNLRGNYYLLGGYVDSLYYRNYTIGIMDDDHSFTKRIEIGDNDKDDFPAMLQTFDFINPNEIFFGGTHNILVNDLNPFGTLDNHIAVSFLDSSLNIKWQKFFGGDAYYRLYFCQATKDKGCLLVGTVYDENVDKWNDVFVLKIDSLGNYIPSSITDDLREELITIYPNPGKSIINIEIPEISEDTYFELYSITGQLMIKEQVIYSTNTISTDNLKSGMYLYRIYNNGKIIKTGKWIKD